MGAAHISVVGQKILLVSRDEDKFLTRHRSRGFERVGYRVFGACNLGQGISIALRIHSDLVILEESFSDHEQVAFVECLHESHPDICVLRLGPGAISTEELVSECSLVMSRHPGGERVHTLGPAKDASELR